MPAGPLYLLAYVIVFVILVLLLLKVAGMA